MVTKGIRQGPGVYKYPPGHPMAGKTYKSKDGAFPGATKGTTGSTGATGATTPTGQTISTNDAFGGTTTSVDKNGNIVNNSTLSAGNQGVVDAGQSAGANAGQVLGGLVGSENFGKTWQENGTANTKQLTDSVFNSLTSRLAPRQEQQRARTEQMLINRGIPVGSDAYNNAMREQEQTFGDQYADAENQAVQKGFDFWGQQAQVGNQTAQTLQGVNQAGYYAPTNQVDANAVFGTQQGTQLGQKQIQSQEKIANMNNQAALQAARIRSAPSGGSRSGGGQPALLPSPFATTGLPNS